MLNVIYIKYNFMFKNKMSDIKWYITVYFLFYSSTLFKIVWKTIVIIVIS